MSTSLRKFTISGSDGIIRVQEWFTGRGQSSNEIALEQFAESGETYVERVDNVVNRGLERSRRLEAFGWFLAFKRLLKRWL